MISSIEIVWCHTETSFRGAWFMISGYLKLALLYLEICSHGYFSAWASLFRYCTFLCHSIKYLVCIYLYAHPRHLPKYYSQILHRQCNYTRLKKPIILIPSFTQRRYWASWFALGVLHWFTDISNILCFVDLSVFSL